MFRHGRSRPVRRSAALICESRCTPCQTFRCLIMDQGVAGETHRRFVFTIFLHLINVHVFFCVSSKLPGCSPRHRFIMESRMRLPRFYPILESLPLAAADSTPGWLAGTNPRRRSEDSSVSLQGTRLTTSCVANSRDLRSLSTVRCTAGSERSCRHCPLARRGAAPGTGRSAPVRGSLHHGDRSTIGYSTHNEQQLRAALSQPADYLALGPIFGTAIKANPDPVVGVEELRRLRQASDRPLVAIGGITRANARGVIGGGRGFSRNHRRSVSLGWVKPSGAGKRMAEPSFGLT